MITRSIQNELLACAKEYPAVTILGPRQSGKTTLSKMAFPKHAYCSLEEPNVRRQAQNDPKGLLGNYSGGVILDEIQRVPDRNIMNQMIIYLDYGSRLTKSKLGVVLYADPRIQEKPIIVRNDDKTKSVFFMNFHPNNPDLVLKLKDILDKEV